MGWRRHLEDFRLDVARHQGLGEGGGGRLLETQGLWAAAVYRYGRWVYEAPHGGDRTAWRALYRLLHKGVEVAAGISLPASAQIGPGLYIGHFGQIIIHPEVVAGRNLSVGQGVTLGTRGGGRPGVPRLGDDVYIGVGAKVLGPVVLGDGARVGANAVVLDDVPAGVTVVGIPARPVGSRRQGGLQ